MNGEIDERRKPFFLALRSLLFNYVEILPLIQFNVPFISLHAEVLAAEEKKKTNRTPSAIASHVYFTCVDRQGISAFLSLLSLVFI